MSVSLQSLMVDIPVTRPKRSRLRKVAFFAVAAILVLVAITVLAAAAGLKFVLGR